MLSIGLQVRPQRTLEVTEARQTGAELRKRLRGVRLRCTNGHSSDSNDGDHVQQHSLHRGTLKHLVTRWTVGAIVRQVAWQVRRILYLVNGPRKSCMPGG